MHPYIDKEMALHTAAKYTDISILEKYPYIDWPKSGLSENRTLTVDYIQKHKNSVYNRWDIKTITRYINSSEIGKHPNFPWDINWESNNKSIKEIILDVPNVPCCYYDPLYMEYTLANIDIMEVVNDPTKKWDRDLLSKNKGLTIEIIEDLEMPYAIGEWNWNYISQYIDIKYVYEYPCIGWNRIYLSMNESLKIDVVKFLDMPYATGPWCWDYISQYINIGEYYKYPNEKWKYMEMSCNKSLTIRDLKFMGILPFDPYVISQRAKKDVIIQFS